jgi:hypothetical protein
MLAFMLLGLAAAPWTGDDVKSAPEVERVDGARLVLQNLRFVADDGALRRVSVEQPLARGAAGWLEVDCLAPAGGRELAPLDAGRWSLIRADGTLVNDGALDAAANDGRPSSLAIVGAAGEARTTAVFSLRWDAALPVSEIESIGAARLELAWPRRDGSLLTQDVDFVIDSAAMESASSSVGNAGSAESPAGGGLADSNERWFERCKPGHVVVGGAPSVEICSPCVREPAPIGDCVGEGGGAVGLAYEGRCVFGFDTCAYYSHSAAGDAYGFTSKREKPCGSVTTTVSGNWGVSAGGGGNGSGGYTGVGGTVSTGITSFYTSTCCKYQKLNGSAATISFLDCH